MLAQNSHVPPDTGGVVVVHDAGLQLEDEIGAALGLVRLAAVGHHGGGRPLLGGEREHAHALEPHLAQPGAQLLKLGIALAGQARDEARAQHKTRNARAQLLQQRADLVAGAVAVHAAENVVVDVLDGDVEILDDLVLICDEVDELVVDDLGVEVVQADPADAVDLRQLPQQPRETRPAVEVHAPAGDVLRDDDQLFHAERGEVSRLLHDGVKRAAAVAAADGGDGAERAPVVAPLGDAQVCPARPGRDHAADLLDRAALVAEVQRLSAVHHILDGLTDLAEAAGAEHAVHFRQALENVVFVPL